MDDLRQLLILMVLSFSCVIRYTSCAALHKQEAAYPRNSSSVLEKSIQTLFGNSDAEFRLSMFVLKNQEKKEEKEKKEKKKVSMKDAKSVFSGPGSIFDETFGMYQSGKLTQFYFNFEEYSVLLVTFRKWL